MADDHERSDRDVTIPQPKRTERDGADPESQPGEYADDMRVNRFTPPPDPPSERERK